MAETGPSDPIREAARERDRRAGRLQVRWVVTGIVLMALIVLVILLIMRATSGEGQIVVEDARGILRIPGTDTIQVTGRIHNVAVNDLRLGDLELVFEGEAIRGDSFDEGAAFSNHADRTLSEDGTALFIVNLRLIEDADVIADLDTEVKVGIYYDGKLQDTLTFDISRLVGTSGSNPLYDQSAP